MSGAKERMHRKKMRNQPSNITFSSPGWAPPQDERRWRNGGEAQRQGRSYGGPQQPGGPRPPSSAPSPQGHPSGGVRGHQWGDSARGVQGYSQKLPRYITASVFAQARAAEVGAMLRAVTKTTGSSHVFGALPKHMRRRAMSHNVRRLPRRLRAAAARVPPELEKTSQQKKEQSKSKSRRARRRHGNLLLEFNRRQRKHVWLETHIWHAKRFHMARAWGYSLGDRPTSKCYRACYRAMSGHCLLQDLSYYCCVEVKGEEDTLLRALARLTSKETGPTFGAAVFLSGRRQGSVVVHRADRYPAEPLGQVLFMWRPKRGPCSPRQLWLWVHPTLKQDLLPELQLVCQCSEPPEPGPPVALPVLARGSAGEEPAEAREAQRPGKKRKRSGAEGEAVVPVKKIIGDGTRQAASPLSWRSEATGIVISDLTMEILRFRLIGPLSHCVLTDTLTPATDCGPEGMTETSHLWWPEQCKDGDNLSLHHRQADIFRQLKGVCFSGEIPAGTILGLAVDDPRLTLPTRRSKTLPDLKQMQGGGEETRLLTLQGVPAECCESPLWEQAVRHNVTENKIPEQELNRMRSELLVPASQLSPTPPQSRVPVLLVHQPGKQVGEEKSSWGTGWDLLLPKGWGMAFWIPLIFRGVRVGGLQEALKHSQNKGAPHFPGDFPDCPAGARFLREQETQLVDHYRRRPPAKRPNYIKHGCLAPFRCPWQQLAEEWEMIVKEAAEEELPASEGHAGPAPEAPGPEEHRSQAAGRGEGSAPRPEFPGGPECGSTSALSDAAVAVDDSCLCCPRSRKALRRVSAWCRPTSARGQRLRGRAPAPAQEQEQQLTPAVVASVCETHGRSLVWTRLSLLRKGRPTLHAMICIPAPEDIQLLRVDPAYSGPQEPRHKDHFRHRRGRRRQEEGEGPEEGGGTPERLGQAPAAGSPEPPAAGLWPEPLPSVTSHCSRVLLGFVTQGDFSLAAGCGEALGFVSLAGLLHMLSGQPAGSRGLVLVRGAASLQYRFAKIDVEV
uniref:POP1 homolog, ribonuclease P/MRP subunit n=1 Tax=Lepisosteus oculatus TaxID=7918 RepID=W5MUE7_LEPOC